MIRIITIVITLVLLTFVSKVTAQNSTIAPCSSSQYKQFNFWVGNWNVYDKQGKLVGENHIKQMPNACAIQENWKSSNGKSLGTSYNYYNQTDKLWHQLWIDNSGFSLDLKGSFDNDTMTLSSKIVSTGKGKYYNRITWKKNTDGSITQTWDYVGENHKVIKNAFVGIYKKK